MINRRGRLLSRALEGLGGADLDLVAPVELRAAPVTRDPLLPVVLQVRTAAPAAPEPWSIFSERVADQLGSVVDVLYQELDPPLVTPLRAASAVATALTMDQLEVVAADPRIAVDVAELDPLLDVAALDTVSEEIGLAAFRAADGLDLTGSGVRVAVLDSGIDASHPALRVVEQVSLCEEDVAVAGVHGTHCAGIIASRDTTVRGVAPDVDLFDIKVLRANGIGTQQWFAQGIDAALDRDVDVISASVAFNHLPQDVDGGHGWSCSDGTCGLCTAVDSAVLFGATVVVAAGNEHERCQRARLGGLALEYDTEIGCPGQATGAITVGSHAKVSHLPAPNSSSGPTAWGLDKPDLVAPGVGILSTVPMPAPAAGMRQQAARERRFATKSGTSAATPVVAGVCALLIEQARRKSAATDPASIRATLLGAHTEAVGGPVNVMGAGRLRLR